MSAAEALIDRLPAITLVVGKGGVGKTTTACALARLTAERHGETLLLTTDPARALPLVLAQDVGSSPTPVKGAKRLHAQALDASTLRASFLDRWGDALRLVLDRGTYLDESDIGPLVDTALPGTDEIFAALTLAEIIAKSAYERMIVDTAPTGHTLRLLRLPQTFRALVRLLDAMQNKHRFMVRALTRAYRADAVDAMLAEMDRLVTALDGALRDPERCGSILVLNDMDVVVAESRRYLDELRALSVAVVAMIWNGSSDSADLDAKGVEQFIVPRLDGWPVGSKGLDAWAAALQPASSVRRSRRTASRTAGRAAKRMQAEAARPVEALQSLLRPLTIVAGKGGVGKTTVASSLAVYAATTARTLVVSTDPAPSLADVFGCAIPDADTAVPGAPQLLARQMDASAAFERLRAEYAGRVDALFAGLIARGVDLAHDHAIARDLLSLAPPGIDEVYALSLIADALEGERYDFIVIDPAPTGHLLRLLEMPSLALDWSHQLLRLMLKYKDVTGLGETAHDVLAFSRSLRSVDAMLRDASRCAVVLVTLDEPVVLAETERLAREVRSRGVAISGVVLNRMAGDATSGALPVPDAPVHFVARTTEPPPTGATALKAWARSWSAVKGAE